MPAVTKLIKDTDGDTKIQINIIKTDILKVKKDK
jgi:hypothetical protein